MLGCRRLAILDPSPLGHQPMTSADGRYSLVTNGEIYNYLELRSELGQRGHAFRSNSDTEVMLAAFAEWDTACFERFEGMFACAVLDRRSQRLILARDFAGIKPLYYARWEGGLAFASTIAALLEFPGLSRKADADVVYRYVRYAMSDDGDRTFFEDVHQLLPGHYAELSLCNVPQLPLAVRVFLRLDTDTERSITVEAAAEELRPLVQRSVELHLRSDVPVAIALSGGVDSSSVLCTARQVQPHADLHTFTFTDPDAAINESPWAELAARRAGATHHPVRLTAHELRRDFDALVQAQEHPFGSIAIYAQNRVFQHAAERGFKVILDGQGSDEVFGGYSNFVQLRLALMVQQGRWGQARKLWQRLHDWPDATGLLAFARVARVLLPHRLRPLLPTRTPGWLNEPWFRLRGVDPNGLRPQHRWPSLRQKFAGDLCRAPLPALLRIGDRNSMAHSMECRVPLLTPALARFASSLPDDCFVADDGAPKAVLRRAMAEVVPDEILQRRDKVGFAVPADTWLHALRDWVEQGFAAAENIPALRANALRSLYMRVVRSGHPSPRDVFMIWRLLGFVRWAEVWAVDFS
jgi:asparagine synthase (glutamine-hydrolysing)